MRPRRTPRSRPAADATAALELASLPTEVVERIIFLLDQPRDVANANAAGRLFRGAPGGRSPVEHALRARARVRGHASALPPTLPPSASTWTEELLARERVLELASAHARPVAAAGNSLHWNALSACVDADGAMHTWGETLVFVDGGRKHNAGLPALGHPELLRSAVCVPTRVASLSAVRMRAVAAGVSHLLALGDDGRVFASGRNYLGQLGHGDTKDRASFAPVAGLRDEMVVCIATGGAHSVAISAAGVAFSWGFNGYGQLGLGEAGNFRSTPCRVAGLDGVRVAGAGAGETHTLLLSACGAVYSCGADDRLHGCLGHGDGRGRTAPERIEALAGVRAVYVSAGHDHSLVVDHSGAVHAFGAGTYGCLGLGDERDRVSPVRVLGALAGVRAARAVAGHRSSAVLGVDGSVHILGWNGPATAADAQSLSPHRVLSCSLCATHALFVTADGAVRSCGPSSAALGLGRCRDWVGCPTGLTDLCAPTRLQQLRAVLHTTPGDSPGAGPC